MGKPRRKRGRGKRGRPGRSGPASDQRDRAGRASLENFLTPVVGDHTPGCHVVHALAAGRFPDWVLADGVERFDPTEFGLSEETEDQMPDISVDVDGADRTKGELPVMTVTNTSHTVVRSFFITLGHRAFGREEQLLDECQWHDLSDEERGVGTTFIVTLGPRSVLDLCTVDNSVAPSPASEGGALDLYSAVSDIDPTALLSALSLEQNSVMPALPFPVGIGSVSGAVSTHLCCSQGSCGSLSHFYPQTLYAVDIACPVGSPIVSRGDACCFFFVRESSSLIC
jgi:hypothetical protein